MTPCTIREAATDDREAILTLLRERWGGETMVVRETVFFPADLPAFVAVEREAIVGLITYVPQNDAWEVMSFDSLVPGQGIGDALLDRLERAARDARQRMFGANAVPFG
jgi:N-acetylglutamate synthase-like GNAT family acetyltransferase